MKDLLSKEYLSLVQIPYITNKKQSPPASPPPLPFKAGLHKLRARQMALRVHENSYTLLITLCKNNLNLPISHYHSVFNFQNSPAESLQPYYSIQSSIFKTPHLKFKVRLIDLSHSDIQILYSLQIGYSAMSKQQLN